MAWTGVIEGITFKTKNYSSNKKPEWKNVALMYINCKKLALN